jgi:plasmid stabilization system protein ParE
VKLRLTEAARDDLRAACRFYAERSPAAAARAIGTILKAASRLTQFPLLGKHGAVEGTRERIVMRFPYRIVYQIEEDTIVVPRIIHTARSWS